MNALINISPRFSCAFRSFRTVSTSLTSALYALRCTLLCSFRNFHVFCAICFITLCCSFSVVGNPVELAFSSTVSYCCGCTYIFLLSVLLLLLLKRVNGQWPLCLLRIVVFIVIPVVALAVVVVNQPWGIMMMLNYIKTTPCALLWAVLHALHNSTSSFFSVAFVTSLLFIFFFGAYFCAQFHFR